MRLMNTAASLPYIHPTELEPVNIPNPTPQGPKDKDYATHVANPNAGQPKPGATVFQLRALTSREDGALQDTIYDLSRTRTRQDRAGETQVDLNMAISPSNLRRNRVRIGIVGWDNLFDHEGVAIPFAQVDLQLGAKTFKAVPEDVMDMMPQSLINAIASQIEKMSSLTPTEGNV